MTTTNSFPAPCSVGLCGDAALRYALVQMVVASPRCDPSAYLTTVEALYEYVTIAKTSGWIDGMKCQFRDGILERVEAPSAAPDPYMPDYSGDSTDPFKAKPFAEGMSVV